MFQIRYIHRYLGLGLEHLLGDTILPPRDAHRRAGKLMTQVTPRDRGSHSDIPL